MEEHAQSPGPEIGGHVEAAYHLNLMDRRADDPVPLRSYDFAGGNNFILHSAHLVLKHAFNDSVSAVIEFDAGSDAAANSVLTSGSAAPHLPGAPPTNAPLLFDIQEAYATYGTDFGLSVTAGKFVTYQGIEVVEGPMNPTITRGFLFGLAEPVSHLGAKIHYSVKSGDSEIANAGVGIVNGWDTYLDNNRGKTLIARIGVSPVPQFWAAVSSTLGPERPTGCYPTGCADNNGEDQRASLDLTGAVIPNEMITINFQANTGRETYPPTVSTEKTDARWFGLGVQPVLTMKEFKTGVRLEWFKDKENTRALTPGKDLSVWNLTVCPGYTFGEKLMLRAEYRFDKANKEIFQKRFNSGTALQRDRQHTIAAAASYMF